MMGMLATQKSAYFANQGLKNLENGVLSIYQDTTDSRHSFTNIFLNEKGVLLSDSLNSELKSTICTVMKIIHAYVRTLLEEVNFTPPRVNVLLSILCYISNSFLPIVF